MSNVTIYGVNALLRDLEGIFNKARVNSIMDGALTDGALVFGMELRRQLATFKDKGYTLEEMTLTNPNASAEGGRSIIVHWRGPHQRYRIIHLNEWGTAKNRYPRGFGKIASAMSNSQKAYGAAVRNSIRRHL